MSCGIAINGFGRIGRLVLRALMERRRTDAKAYDALNLVAINDLAPIEHSAHLLNYDSVHGRLDPRVETDGAHFKLPFGKVRFCSERDPLRLPWKDLGVDLVLECSGIFTAKEKAMLHCAAGAKRVLISAPGQGADATIVFGVNDASLNSSHVIVSNASCTTNCLAPVVKVLDAHGGVDYGTMTTVHAYTGDQHVVDSFHKDLRRARAAALSMIPTSTGAARAVGEVLPHLKGRIDGSAVRVPTPNVSLVDFVCTLKKETTAEALLKAFRKASQGELKGVLAVSEEPLVSSDLNHTAVSSTVDAGEVRVLGGRMVRVLAWYDNEWGFANRMLDVASLMASG